MGVRGGYQCDCEGSDFCVIKGVRYVHTYVHVRSDAMSVTVMVLRLG